jgi:16S rRNA (cytosine967-C5)-methyltransferase
MNDSSKIVPSKPVRLKTAGNRPSGAKPQGKPAGGGAKDIRSGSEAGNVAPARLTAFEILMLVGAGKGHSDELLHSSRLEKLSQEDRNLTTALVMGVLRWQIALDARLQGFLQRPGQRLAEPIAVALRMGAFQLLHLDRVPAHAALSESVELCRVGGQPHAAGMVNAVLRKLAVAQRPGLRLREAVAAFAERLGHPRWLVERWVAAYGRDAAYKICEADQKEPVGGGMFSEGGNDLPQMDDGSRLVAELAAVAMPEARRVWDCCAAPGGKTLMLARRLPAAEIVATDVSSKRLELTESRLKRYAYAERVLCGVTDAVDGKGVEGSFDLILCDAPCSGTGTLASNPEIRHQLKAADLTRQVDRQKKILNGALRRLAPGGRLVYSTCSLEPEECEQVVAAVLANGSLRQVPVDGMIAELAEQGVLLTGVGMDSAIRDGALRTLPGVHGCDGFFAVVLEKA